MTAEKTSASPLKILIVEDNPDDALLVRRLLTKEGEGRFEYGHVGRLSEALVLLSGSAFDVVLLDLSLPDGQGLETLERVHARAPQLPIVVLTSREDEAVATQAIQKGAQDFLPKRNLSGVLLSRTIRYSVERRRAEEALRASEERFRSVTQSANEAIIVADDQGEIVSWNRGAQAIFGYEEQEVLGRPLTALMPERYRHAHLKGLGRFRSTGVAKVVGKVIELHGLRKDGSEIPVEMSLATWKNGPRMFFSGIIRDITARRQAEVALRESEERFRSLAASAPIGIFCTDAQGVCVYNNPRWQAIVGLSLEESLGTGWTRAVHPEDRQSVVDYWTMCAQHGSAFYREFRVQNSSDEVKWVHWRATAIQSGGNVVGYVGTVEDITEHRQAEVERETLIRQLHEALSEVKTLGRLLPICAGCKKIRDDNGYWNQIENYIAHHTGARFTHSYCPDCAARFLREDGLDNPGMPIR